MSTIPAYEATGRVWNSEVVPSTSPHSPEDGPASATEATAATATTAATRAGAALLVVGLVLLALNLRPAAVSVGPVLAEVRSAFGMSPLVAGVLTSLPVVAFAGFGAMAPWAARVVGVHRVTLLSLAAVVVGLLARAVTTHQFAFLGWSLLALAGMACANVLAPSLVKLHFPHRTGWATALYTTSMAVGLTLALTTTVPIAEATGSWRVGIGAWAVLAVLAAVPWLRLVAHDRHLEQASRTVTFGQVARTKLGWTLACFFGTQSALAYMIFGWFAQMWRDNGISATQAGILVGVLAGVGIPVSLVLPSALARSRDQRPLMVAVMACYPVGLVGLILAPATVPWLWALLVGIGACTFPIILTMIGLRSRTPGGTAALSGFAQSVGYLIAAPGPFVLGWVHDLSGGWTWPLLLMLAMVVPLVLLGLAAGRPTFLEDQIRGVP